MKRNIMTQAIRRPRHLRQSIQLAAVGLLLFALLVLSTTPLHAQAEIPPESDPADLNDIGDVSAFIDGVMTAGMAEHHIPGSVVVIVKDGEVFFARGYGYADLENKTPVDPATTLFRPGSISKLFTWTAVMQLVEQGKLSLDEDVNSYLDFPIPDTFDKPITLRHLMTHTAGFEDIGLGLFVDDAEEVTSLETYVKTYLPTRVFPVGTIGAYSNYGTALSGYIVERVSDEPFESYIANHILAPLGMSNASFEQPLPDGLAGQMSGGYNYMTGEFVQGGFEYIVGSPAGALSASGLDMAKFMLAHLNDGEYNGTRILQPETAQLMHSLQYQPDPRIDGLALGFFYNEHNGQTTLHHGGDTFIFHSQLFLFPDSDMGLFFSSNGNDGETVGDLLVNSFINRYFNETEASLELTADFADRAARYAGSYSLARQNFTTFEAVMALFQPINVQVTQHDQVLVNFLGHPRTYVETEPGLLVNVDDPDDRLALGEYNSQTTLSPSLPFTFLKTPPQGSPALHALNGIGGLLLFLIAVLCWIGDFRRRRADDPQPNTGERLARWSAAAFGVCYTFFVAVLAMQFLNLNPGFGVPQIFLGAPAWFDLFLQFPIILIILALAMLVFCLIAWIKQYWHVRGRLFFTLLTLLALSNLWGLSYWNLLI
ncbi:MAG: beta-lactamase family protein [Anaerolineaceae bacterium]|nr:beta-lactamase family protein [Anaerolineaceae bacterium]